MQLKNKLEDAASYSVVVSKARAASDLSDILTTVVEKVAANSPDEEEKVSTADRVCVPEPSPEQVMVQTESQSDPFADSYYGNIEETIDEFERRIKAEGTRYKKIVANRELYQ